MITFLKKVYRFNFSAYFQDKLALKHFKSQNKILDVGCGNGRFINFDPQRICGVDSNPDTVKHCQLKKLKVKKAISTKLPFKNNTFDGVHCSHVIEHLTPKDVYLTLKEFTRVLRVGGILIIRSPILWPHFYDNLTHLKPYPPKAITRYLVEEAPDTTYKRLKTKFDLVNLYWRYRFLTKTGYTLVLKKIK